ncbi:helix-turn-helix domain-containing protein [Paenibacillus sp. OV219]|uniref:helix-turn-helix domain-containing protein n=1 Tax=Paenibacillus sp. OV219 TaxID=1884377 RepID=UPI0008D8694C|nr:helix-turn-helix domain-containing protein [Paenibacillus sp. OV219]SEP11078.1 PAS domain S-box-containing protein [Paenibacillus sp. OV219]
MMVDMFANTANAILIIREQQNSRYIHDCTKSFCHVTGFKQEALIGNKLMNMPESVTNELWPLIDRMCDMISDKLPEAHAEVDVTAPNNMHIFAELHVKPIRYANDSYYLLTFRDRSEHKWIDDLLVKQRVELSLVLTSAGSITSMRSYHEPIPFDRQTITMQPGQRFVAESDRERVRAILDTLRSRTDATAEPLMFKLQLFEDQYLAHALIRPFFYADGTFRCFAICILSVETLHQADEKPTKNMTIAMEEYSQDEMNEPSFKLRLLMLKRNMTVTKLAEHTQISLTTISNIRNGKIKKPQRLTAHLIAEQLGVSPDEIWGSL